MQSLDSFKIAQYDESVFSVEGPSKIGDCIAGAAYLLPLFLCNDDEFGAVRNQCCDMAAKSTEERGAAAL